MDEVPPKTQAIFDAAVEHVNSHSYPSKHKLKLYGLYKHVTVGKCNVKKPMMVNVSAKAKYEAWKACEKLSVAEAMDKYSKLLAEIDPSFSPSKVKVESADEFQAVEELNKLPPPVPPGIGSFVFANMAPSLPKNYLDDIHVQSGFDPDTNEADDEDRITLHEKLVKFYRAVDPNRLVKGIGEIVDFGLTEGKDKLNQTLRNKYGVSLTEIEDKEKQRITQIKEHMSVKLPTVPKETYTNIDKTEASKLADQLERFFMKYDPEKLPMGRETGFSQLLKYCDKRGVAALNKKLVAKYGRSLEHLQNTMKTNSTEFFDSKKMSSPYAPRTASKLGFKDLPSELFRSNNAMETGRAPSKKMSSRSNASVRSKEGMASPVNTIELPEYVKPALISFYARYEQERLRDGSVKKVYTWAKRNGLRKLNRELKQRYKQSLDEFVEDSDRLRDELIAFYRKIDESKIETGLDRILNWGIKNGRTALNRKFMKKYGFDLNTYTVHEPGVVSVVEGSIEF